MEYAAYVIAAVVAVCAAGVYLTSRYRKAADAEKDKYIAVLEARNQFLESTNQRHEQDQTAMKKELYELRGQVKFLRDLVLGRCPHADLDEETGGCRNCAFGMAYGQGGKSL